MPRISIITPTYNQAGTIRQTIESVLSQDWPDVEHWVLDAGSKDGTVEILREFEKDPRARGRFHWVSEPDKGQSDAINKGLARCTGDIFNWCNSDDYLEPGALRAVAEAFEKNPKADVVSGETEEFWDSEPGKLNRIRLQLRDSAESAITVGVYCQVSTFWRTTVVRELGGIDASLHYVMDWNLWVRYLALYGQSKVVQLDQLLAHYRHHAGAKTSAASSGFYDEAKRVFQNLHLTLKAPEKFLIPEAGCNPKWERKEFRLGPDFSRERYLGAYADRMVRVYRKKNPVEAKQWLKRGMKYPPGLSLWRMKMGLRLMFR